MSCARAFVLSLLLISGLNLAAKDKDKDNKKTTNAYTGGASSGLNVENPEEESDFMNNLKKNPNDKEKFDKIKNKIKF